MKNGNNAPKTQELKTKLSDHDVNNVRMAPNPR
jgi:hypothetical protein